jgi:hypothetical protein
LGARLVGGGQVVRRGESSRQRRTIFAIFASAAGLPNPNITAWWRTICTIGLNWPCCRPNILGPASEFILIP